MEEQWRNLIIWTQAGSRLRWRSVGFNAADSADFQRALRLVLYIHGDEPLKGFLALPTFSTKIPLFEEVEVE